MFSGGKLKIKGKRVADVVKALIGSYLSSGGEVGTLRFMKWLGMKIYFANAPLLKLFPMNDEKYLEFIGNAVLDYAVTAHLYFKYLRLTPGLITDMSSASVNNEFYAQLVVKAGLHKHILHASQELKRQISHTVEDFRELDLMSTFG
ncbi:hypothetical protein FXO38_10991 [Capsicum annuum]